MYKRTPFQSTKNFIRDQMKFWANRFFLAHPSVVSTHPVLIDLIFFQGRNCNAFYNSPCRRLVSLSEILTGTSNKGLVRDIKVYLQSQVMGVYVTWSQAYGYHHALLICICFFWNNSFNQWNMFNMRFKQVKLSNFIQTLESLSSKCSLSPFCFIWSVV